MGIAQRSQITGRIGHWLAAAWMAAGLISFASAADKPADPTPTPEPEPTEIPRPDELNLKKPSSQDALLSRDWLKLTLLKNDDVAGLKKIPDYATPALRRQIHENFGLPAVMTMKDAAKSPPGWWGVETHGIAALGLGPTRHFNRPELKVEAPMLRLREIPYLVGESDFVLTMNEVVRLWTLGRVEEAQKLRSQLQADKKKLPRGTLERAAVAILNGFLDLQLAAQSAQPIFFYGPSLGSLWDALGSTELKIFLDVKGQNKVDVELFRAALNEPALFSNSGIYPPKLSQPKLKARSMELQMFIRTLALPAIFNVASLSAQAQNWTRVYEASQKFDEIYALLDRKFTEQQGQDLLFTTPSGVAVTHPMLMMPQTAHQLQVIMRILKARAQFVAEDPLFALRETAKVILTSQVPAFKTLGFSLAGDIYDDLGYPKYARRFYSFAEVFADVEWYQQNPHFLLGGAENAFWSGDYELARNAFEKFLLSAGDKQFGPWARLRLAEIEHLQKGSDKALHLYEELLRGQPGHPAGLIARRRVFCITAPQTGARTRHQEYLALKELFPKFEFAEIEQIRACHLNSLVADAANFSEKTVKSLPEDAKLQLELIEEFKDKFPLSSYLKFFETRKMALQGAMGPYYLAFKQCEPALEFVRKNGENIKTLQSHSGQFLSTLKWTKEEQERLLRCGALFSSLETVEKIQKLQLPSSTRVEKKSGKFRSAKKNQSDFAESAEQKIARMTLEMFLRPSDKLATDLLSELRRRGRKTIGEDVKELESQGSQLIDAPDFWFKLATLKVMQWDLQHPASKKPQLNRFMRAEVLRRPDLTLQIDEFCHRFLMESSSLSAREWDAFVLSLPTSRWLEVSAAALPASQPSPQPAGPSSDEKKQADVNKSPRVPECAAQISAEALRTAQSLPSLARDKHLLWPWLQARGVQQEQEAWLALGQRWAQQGSVSKQELENLFKTLEKEADNPVVKQAAKAWRESQKPANLW